MKASITKSAKNKGDKTGDKKKTGIKNKTEFSYWNKLLQKNSETLYSKQRRNIFS